jgi:hypothetical protein
MGKLVRRYVEEKLCYVAADAKSELKVGLYKLNAVDP